jgi:hypothetical protein
MVFARCVRHCCRQRKTESYDEVAKMEDPDFDPLGVDLLLLL